MDILAFGTLAGGLVWFLASSSEGLGYRWQWYRVMDYLVTTRSGTVAPGPLTEGLLTTLVITAASIAVATVLGLLTAVARLSDFPAARSLARLYLESIRNTPLLTQIFLMYFVLGPVLNLDRFASAVLALGLFEGAYASEIFRAGILSVPKGQWEAALGLGLGTARTYRHVILPQAVRRMLPPLTGQAVSLIKDSALVSTIAIADLTLRGQTIIAETYLTFEIWFTVAAIYLLLTVPLSAGARWMERWLAPDRRRH